METTVQDTDNETGWIKVIKKKKNKGTLSVEVASGGKKSK
jgi:hypothetical protein